jgi:hypothetical protein
MKLTEFGEIVFKATAASGSLPVPDAIVRIRGAEEANRQTVYSLLTDIDGITQIIKLPAPSKAFSEAPRSPEYGYASYDVEVSANGYYPKRIYGIPIFPDTTTVQPINMIPLAQSNPYSEIPKGNLNTVIQENPML